ncbi:Hypothetical protein PHPALM_8188 [Phytophthora palmivora]|uniref:Integrase catalytic domain-containing protein n=1 Tax=Phytophthora palmivora TaxID=4796 RepID=A0A2P4YAE8_9STRA|nr:Hypothetical protein PHPALM_8188 [Phytophthora palmivora]
MGECKYVLVLKDGLTHFCELVACDTPTSIVAATALVDWWKRFGAPSILISNQGSHFKNDLITMLDIDQSLVVAYAPWINGTVERLNRDVLQVLRVLLMEYSLDTHEWVYLLPLVQGNLNHTPVRSLGCKAPSELFTGLPRPTPFEPILLERGQRVEILETTVLPIEQLDQLRVSLAGLHKEVLDQREKRRLQNMARSKGIECNFSVGDFVLWSRIDSRLSTDKLLARWVGPFEVTETAPHSFTIRHLVTNKHYVVHGSRLKFYADSSFEVNEELLAHVGNQGMVLGVESITKHRKANGVWQLLVSWEGLQEEENSWEPLVSLHKDVPSRVQQYVDASNDTALIRAHSMLVQVPAN